MHGIKPLLKVEDTGRVEKINAFRKMGSCRA